MLWITTFNGTYCFDIIHVSYEVTLVVTCDVNLQRTLVKTTMCVTKDFAVKSNLLL